MQQNSRKYIGKVNTRDEKVKLQNCSIGKNVTNLFIFMQREREIGREKMMGRCRHENQRLESDFFQKSNTRKEKEK